MKARIQPLFPMNPHLDSHPSPAAPIPKQRFWQKLGGGSLSISLILHLFLLAGGVIWVFQVIPKEEPKVDFTTRSGSSPASELRETKQRAQMIQPNPSQITARDVANGLTLPEPEQVVQMTSLGGIGAGSLAKGPGEAGSGFTKDSWQNGGMTPGGGTGPLFRLIPPDMRKRCSKGDRLARLKENGGTPACDEAVVKGLRWLKANQNPDGSWGGGNRAAMTGFSLLAYFGHCETPASEEFGDSCMRGIVYLVNLGMKNDGKMAGNFTGNSWVYEHAIATYALGEAATFCKELKMEIPNLMEVTEKAGQFIIDNQNENGGWAYSYVTTQGGHTDTSVVGWQLQALKACSHTHIKYKGMDSSVKKGLQYLAKCQAENGSFGYNGPGGRTALTGVGVLCHQVWGKGKSAEARNGVKFIKENFGLDWNTADSDLYSHYYASQAMMQAGGSYWKSYNDLFRDQLLNNQNPDGSWKAPKFDGHGLTGNEVYRNTLCILMLEVYYRFLNSGGGASERPGI